MEVKRSTNEVSTTRGSGWIDYLCVWPIDPPATAGGTDCCYVTRCVWPIDPPATAGGTDLIPLMNDMGSK